MDSACDHTWRWWRWSSSCLGRDYVSELQSVTGLLLIHRVMCEQGVASREVRGKGDDVSVRSIFVYTSKWFFTCRKILRHGASGSTYPLKENVLWIFIALKNPLPWPGLNPWTLGPIALMITIIPPRQLCPSFVSAMEWAHKATLA
jgi:hypothetical protein